MNGMLTLATALAERGSWWPDSWYGRCWVVFGLGGQVVFAARFLVQWIASERRGRSHIPLVFWHLSIVGALMLLSYYALWKHDLAGVLGQSPGSFVYVRNLMLLRREREQARGAQERGTTQ